MQTRRAIFLVLTVFIALSILAASYFALRPSYDRRSDLIARHDRLAQFWLEQAAKAGRPDSWNHPFLGKIRDVATCHARKVTSLREAIARDWSAENSHLISQDAQERELLNRMWNAALRWSEAAPPGTPPLSFDQLPSY